MKKRIISFMLAGLILISQGGMTALAYEGEQADEMAMASEEVAQTYEAAAVTKITVHPASVAALGGTVHLSVEGTGLTADNWGAEVHAYIAGTDFCLDGSQDAVVTDISLSGAVITIPSNTKKNTVEYRVTAGVKNGASVQNQATAVIQQEPKGETVDVEVKSVEMTDNFTVKAVFAQNVTAALADINELKKKIFFADYNNENASKVALTDTDSITISGDTLTINLQYTFEASSLTALYIQEGALKADGVIVKPIKHFITAKPRVTEIVFDEDIFDYTGGKVTARLKGVRLNELQTLTAKVFIAGETEAAQIPVEITEGAAPVITFNVPENRTDRTESYLLKVMADDQPVYEATAENPARRAIVSVMAKGVSKEEQTLSAMTITGNNRLETESGIESKDITVKVSKQVGELKVVLRLAGTNLDAKKTKVRAYDENGVLWPVYDVPE